MLVDRVWYDTAWDIKQKASLEAQRIRANQQIQAALMRKQEVAPPATRDTLTRVKYDALHNGMTIPQVVSFTGPRFTGMMVQENRTEASPVFRYQWENADGTRLTVDFRDGLMTGKSQVGLL